MKAEDLISSQILDYVDRNSYLGTVIDVKNSNILKEAIKIAYRLGFNQKKEFQQNTQRG